MGDFDQQDELDRKSGKKTGKNALPPGKVAGTDNYGQGGAGVNAPVPGKQSGTGHLPDGPNNANDGGTVNGTAAGKTTAVDAKGNGKATDGKGEGDAAKKGGGSGGGGGGGDEAKTADADHGDAAAATPNGSGKGKGKGEGDKGDKAAKTGDKDAAGKKAGGKEAAAVAGKEKKGQPMHAATAVAPAQRVDAPTVTSVPVLTLDAPAANKSLSDKWLKETGRTIEQHHQQIQQALTELSTEVQTRQTELMSLADTQVTKVTSDITAKVETFKSTLIMPGKARVEGAYGGLTKSLQTAEQKALADIAKHKDAGKNQITIAKTTNAAQLTQKFTSAKAIVEATVAKNVPLASKSIKEWAVGIPNWVKTAKDKAKAATEQVAASYDPNKGSAADLGSAGVALEEDVKKNHTLKHGEKLGKQYESSLVAWSKDTDKKADEVVRLALKSSKDEFEAALGIGEKSSTKGIGDAFVAATAQLDTNEATAKKSVSDAKATGIKRFETEKKDAVDAADKAGKELTDNATAAGTELTDRIKKKAADDSKTYVAIVTDLQKQLKKGKPQKFEDVQPKIAAAKQQLAKVHETNTTELGKLVTEGTTALGETLKKHQDVYNAAIKDREDGAKKTEGEVLKDIDKGATTMGGSLSALATEFATTTTKETQRLDAMIAAFNANADTATKEFGPKVTQHLEAERTKLEENLKANLEPGKIKSDVEPDTVGEIAAKRKALGKDAGELRNAMDGWGTDEGRIFAILRKCSYGEVTYLEAVYNDHYSWRGADGMTPLRADFADEMGGNELQIASSYLNHDRTTAIKLELADSTGFWNDDEARIEEVLRGASEDEIKYLNTDADAKKVVADVKTSLGGCDLDVMNTLLDTKLEKEDRASKADAMRLFDAMDGWGTDEAKMKKILEGAQTPEERAKLRANFNQYATSKGWSGGDGGAKGEEDDALSRAIKDDTEDGERALMLTLAKTERSEEDVKIAKLYEGADGVGTNEDQIFEALDDAEYAKAWAAAKTPAEKKALEEARKARLDAKLDKMSGGEFKSVQGLIDSEMSRSNVTYEEFKNGKRENGTPLTAQEIAQVRSRDPGINKLEWMVAQRKLQTGQAEPELMLAYACWGVVGTDEETIQKTISNGGEPKSIKEINAIRGAFQERWGVALTTRHEFEPVTFDSPAPGGVLADELSGKDWNKTRQLMCGKPETAEQLKYLTDLQAKYATSGLIGGKLMAVGEAIGFTEAKSTAEKSQARFDEYYDKNFKNNPTASLQSAQGERLEALAEYLTQDYEAYSAALSSLVDGIVTALEVIGGVIITVVTAGTASPVLAAVIANLVLSAGTITFKYAALGDQYGAAELATDVVKAVGTAAFAGLGEVKALNNLTEKVGAATAGKVQKLAQLADQTAAKVGVKFGEKGLEMGPKAIENLTKIVSAGTKNVIINSGQEVYNTLTDEKTYEKKLGEVLWGEDSLGAKILKGAPRAFAEGAVTQWINEAAGTSNKDNAGHSTGPKSNALTNAIAEMGGATAGFFVYVDNYQDAEQFWIQLLKTNAQKGISGSLNGYAMHKTRAKKLGRDFINGDMSHEGLAEMAKSMDEHELADLAKFVEKYAPEKVASLPDEYKKYVAQTAPANTNTNANGNTGTNIQPAGTNDEQKTVEAKQDGDHPAAKQDGDEEKTAAPVVKKGEDEQKPQVKDEEEKKSTAKPDEESDIEAKTKKKQGDEETKQNLEDELKAKAHEEELRRKQLADEELRRQQDEEDLRWANDDEGEGHIEDKDAKRRAKRKQKEASEEQEQEERDAQEDAREAVKEGDERRREKKERRREEKRKKAVEEKRKGELLDLATAAHQDYAGKIEGAKAVLKEIVGDLGEVQGRAKDPESAANRLKRAEDNFGAKITDVASAKDNIWDALGTRIVVSGNPQEMAEVMKRITDAVKAGKFEVVKAASNHGDGVQSYLSQTDLDAINAASGGKADTHNGVKKADADKSAFTSGLIFVKYPDGTRGEIQIIGKATLEVAAIEHIPYDVSLGKPLARGIDEKHAPEMKVITGPVEEAIQALNKDPAKKAEYDQYLRDLYKHARATELGQESTPPKLPDGIDKSLSAEGLKHIYDQIEQLKAKAKAEAAGIKPEDGQASKFGKPDEDSGKTPKNDGEEADAKTREPHLKQTEKPDAETDEAARERRSVGVKPTSKDTNTENWADPSDRKGVPETVPLSRQELRDIITEKYHATMKKYLEHDAVKSSGPQEKSPYHDLIEELKQRAPGSIDKKEAAEFLKRWDTINKEIEAKRGYSEADLRTLYNLVEQEDFPRWYENLKHLPKEQQARIGHMWREEWKIYVRDMMTDEHSKEVLYLRDRAMSGDRRGARFEDLMASKLAKKPGDVEGAYDGIIKSSMTSNQAVNKMATGSETGLDEAVASKIRESAVESTGKKKYDSKGALLETDENGQVVTKKKGDGGPEGEGNASEGDAKKLGKPDAEEAKPPVVRAAETEAEKKDAEALSRSTDLLDEKFGDQIKQKVTPPPEGKPVLSQGPGDALIGLPTDAISPTMTADAALQAFKEKGIPRWPGLSETERAHETKFANDAERNLEKMVDQFFKRSQKDGDLFEFEVDGAKKLYGPYGEQKDNSKQAFSKEQLEVRALANHALHPTAVAIARLAFLKRLDMLQPGEQIFVTNGGCGGGKSFLTGLAQDALPTAKFKAVWDAAGEGDAAENLWVLQAAQKRGLKVTYGFVENDPMKNYENVLKRADSQGRIVDPITYARSYVRGQKNMKAFLDSPEYQKALADDPTSVQAIGLNFREKIKDKDNKQAGLLGTNNGLITAKDIPDAPDETTVTAAAIKDFEKWLEAKKAAGDPNVAMWLEGGAANAMKFKPALEQAVKEEASTKPKKLGEGDEQHETESQPVDEKKTSPQTGKDVPTKLVLKGAGDSDLASKAAAIPPEPGFFDLAIHGSADSFGVMHNGKWVELTPNSVRKYLKAMGYPEGMPIRLLSCEAGGAGAHLAQALANGLGVVVKAPTDTLWVWDNGMMTIGAQPEDNTGHFATFKPGKKLDEQTGKKGDSSTAKETEKELAKGDGHDGKKTGHR